MMDKHLKGWLSDERKNEKGNPAAYKETMTEGTKAGPDRTEMEGTDESRVKMPAEASNW